MAYIDALSSDNEQSRIRLQFHTGEMAAASVFRRASPPWPLLLHSIRHFSEKGLRSCFSSASDFPPGAQG